MQPNEVGKMPGLWQLQSWQLPVFTNRGKGRREGGREGKQRQRLRVEPIPGGGAA